MCVCWRYAGWRGLRPRGRRFRRARIPPRAPPRAKRPQWSTAFEFEGNRLIRSETLTARIFTRTGDPYSEQGLRRDFQALWNTGFFEDIRLEVQNDPNRPNGKIVIFHVVERPTIRKIEYRGNKSISESDILDAFKMAKVGLAVESRFDPTKITKAKVVLEEMEAGARAPVCDREADVSENPGDQRDSADLHNHGRSQGQGRYDHLHRQSRFLGPKTHPLDEENASVRDSRVAIRDPRDAADLRSSQTGRRYGRGRPRDVPK